MKQNNLNNEQEEPVSKPRQTVALRTDTKRLFLDLKQAIIYRDKKMVSVSTADAVHIALTEWLTANGIVSNSIGAVFTDTGK